jgi:hypothetical protein
MSACPPRRNERTVYCAASTMMPMFFAPLQDLAHALGELIERHGVLVDQDALFGLEPKDDLFCTACVR